MHPHILASNMGAWMQHPLILTGVYKGVTMGGNLKAYDEVCDCMGIFDDLTGTIGMVDDDRRSLDSLERLVLEMTPGLRIAWSVIDGPRAVSLTLDAGRDQIWSWSTCRWNPCRASWYAVVSADATAW